jgi:hypothetical protein
MIPAVTDRPWAPRAIEATGMSDQVSGEHADGAPTGAEGTTGVPA